MEILSPEKREEFEQFMSAHPQGGFTQSTYWPRVKNNWGYEGVLSRGEDGRIKGAVSLLIQKIPATGTCFFYAPRGPVCDLHDRETLMDLKRGVDQLAERYKAHTFKMDPDVLYSDKTFASIAREMGFSQICGSTGFETIQARFNYRLYLQGRTEEELLKAVTQKTRYNIRLAQRKGVEIRVMDLSALDDFMRIMQVTGERDGFAIRPREYFVRMLTALGEHARLYMGFYNGVPISGAITTNYAGKTCYVYGASDNQYRNVMPNYLMQWEMIRWAVETGCTVYDFQGVSGDLSPENPLYGLYRFKSGFNGTLDELAGEFDYVYRPLDAQRVAETLKPKGQK